MAGDEQSDLLTEDRPPIKVNLSHVGLDYDVEQYVIPLAENRFRIETSSIIGMEYFLFLFGDTFVATPCGGDRYQFVRFDDTTSYRHILFDLGTFVGGPPIEDLDEKRRHTTEFVKDAYFPLPLREALLACGGSWEIDWLFGYMLTIHFPRENEKLILDCIKATSPDLLCKEPMDVHAGHFEFPEG